MPCLSGSSSSGATWRGDREPGRHQDREGVGQGQCRGSEAAGKVSAEESPGELVDEVAGQASSWPQERASEAGAASGRLNVGPGLDEVHADSTRPLVVSVARNWSLANRGGRFGASF